MVRKAAKNKSGTRSRKTGMQIPKGSNGRIKSPVETLAKSQGEAEYEEGEEQYDVETGIIDRLPGEEEDELQAPTISQLSHGTHKSALMPHYPDYYPEKQMEFLCGLLPSQWPDNFNDVARAFWLLLGYFHQQLLEQGQAEDVADLAPKAQRLKGVMLKGFQSMRNPPPGGKLDSMRLRFLGAEAEIGLKIVSYLATFAGDRLKGQQKQAILAARQSVKVG